jgi:sugar phosphate permease
VDNSWGIAYAMVMFISGFVAERVDLRYFLTIGMIGSALGSILFGMSQFFGIHSFAYFVIIRIFSGAMQSTGWPSVVPIMGNWFGKKRRGLLMGIWNSHTSVGNMLGLLLAAQWANPDAWEWSFFAPGFIMLTVAMLIFLFLVVDPSHVGLPQPVHHLKSDIRFVKKSIQVPDDDDDKVDDIGDKKTINLTGIIKKMLNLVKTVVIGNNRGAISIVGVLTIPGVIEYSLALFFSKLVAYTFLFWLPYYVKSLCFSDNPMTSKEADEISVLFDVGGILGSLFAGLFSDLINARAITCVLMLYLSIPSLFFYHSFGHTSYATFISLMIICGILINGPYACITTAVSSDLGTHRSLKGNQKAKATVSAIIDGTGSIGAAIGPFLIGWVVENVSYPWEVVFYILMGSCFLSSLFLSRLVFTEVKQYYLKFTTRKYVSDILE